MSFNASDSAVVHGFQAFYYELLRLKEKALSLYFSPEVSTSPNEAISDEEVHDENEKKPNEVEGVVVEIQKKLLMVIGNVTDIMLAKSRIAPRFINDAKYIMTVLADEVFLNLRWEGAKFWRFTLLEKQLFQSESAGDKFFSMMDEAVLDVNNEEMAFLYLMALSLGFKGKYRDLDNSDEHISWYKDRLYAILNSKPARLFFPGRSRMIESCYDYTYMESEDTRLPDARFWSWCIVSVVFFYVVISYLVWNSITSDVGNALQKISEQISQGPLI